MLNSRHKPLYLAQFFMIFLLLLFIFYLNKGTIKQSVISFPKSNNKNKNNTNNQTKYINQNTTKNNSSSLSYFNPVICPQENVSKFLDCAKRTTPSEKENQALIYLLKIFHEYFNQINVTYFAAFGSLLGIIRHNGHRIPYDDDYDFLIHDNDKHRVIDQLKNNKTIKKQFPNLRLLLNPRLIRVFLEDKNCFRSRRKVEHCWPSIDAVLYKTIGLNLYQDQLDKTKFYDNDTFPLIASKLEGIKTWIPNNWMSFLPKNALKTCCTHSWDHKYYKYRSCKVHCLPCTCLGF